MSNKKGKKVYGVKVILDFPNYFNLNTYVLNFLTEKKITLKRLVLFMHLDLQTMVSNMIIDAKIVTNLYNSFF